MCCALRNIKYFIMLQLSFSGLSDRQVCSAEDSSSLYPFDKALRQHLAVQDMESLKQMTANRGPVTDSAQGEAWRFTDSQRETTRRRRKRTTPKFVSRPHFCDHMAKPCLHAYVTGKICSRTINYQYNTFETYCLMEYVNCREGFELWQMVYAGACFDLVKITDYMFYAYHHDKFLDNYYIMEEKTNPKFPEYDAPE